MPSGNAAALGAQAQAILKTAFATDQGQTSQLTEMGDAGYFMVQVASVAPAAARPLADVRDQAAKLWQDEARQQALQKAADAIASEVNNGGKSLKDLAAAQKLTLTTTAPLQRAGGDEAIPPALVAKLFDAKEGQAVTESGGANGILVAQLHEDRAGRSGQGRGRGAQLAQELGASLQGDTVAEYDEALRKTFPVTIDQGQLDKVMQ